MPPSHKRLLKEASELSASPSPHFHAAPALDNLYDWHFTLAGPPSPSPYAGGIYHGRIVLPPTYPLRPPSFRFLTPTGRFEVNREICLSISGHHEESWQPAWGIRTALIAIRSFMDGDAKGQVGGLDVPEEVRREYARRSGGWCCEVCGRSNEVILEEWRGECREKGVVVDGDGDGEVEVVQRQDGEETETKVDKMEDGQDSKTEDSKANGSRENGLSEQVSERVPEDANVDSLPDAGSSAKSEPLQEQQSSSSLASASASASASTTTSAPTPASAQPATSSTTTTPPTPTRTTQPAVAPVSQSTHPDASQDGPWLDRAIVGVLIALVIFEALLNKASCSCGSATRPPRAYCTSKTPSTPTSPYLYVPCPDASLVGAETSARQLALVATFSLANMAIFFCQKLIHVAIRYLAGIPLLSIATPEFVL
ncbi:UBC-like protein [Aspergillus steynii IBT 23096]|uniref:UBC-like protein n=1 Tax=Aspergillus steynii IBT 23096 TaxID=1392250 RepID=A0A2I2GE50_9EURO|nr:UBC-like protein [Aspergillus steynii IBT 23096]PLB51179.1 UBC-like protein [Aspergillus steynii IBT 23096]